MTYVKRILFALATFAAFASPATAKDPKDRMWMALTRVQCGGVSVVIWREVDDPADYYGTTEYAWDRDDTSGGRFPRVQGFVYNDDTGEAFLNGKQCTGVREEIRGIKIRNPRSRDDAAQQSSRICFDPGRSHDERELGCSAVIESGRESGRTLSMAFCNRGPSSTHPICLMSADGGHLGQSSSGEPLTFLRAAQALADFSTEVLEHGLPPQTTAYQAISAWYHGQE